MMKNKLYKLQFDREFKILITVSIFLFSFNVFSEENFTVNKESKKESTIQESVLGMNVSGNKEAPNLLYIIPWKDSTEHSKPPEINRLMDEVFSTIDPDVYEKELGFYQQLTNANTTIIDDK